MTDIVISRTPVAAAPNLIRVGTRGSELAVTQAGSVARRLADATGREAVLVIIKTTGDSSPAPLAQLGGTGVFVSALRDALLAGACDVAVHSLKDLPTGECPGIVLGAIPERADARDAFCGRDGLTLAGLPAGAKIGTGSPRRAAQLLRLRSDLEVCDLRGNVDSRLARVGADLDGVVLAAAGLKRIGRDAAVSEYFALADAPTAPGQGALAVEARVGAAGRAADAEAGDPDAIRRALAEIDDREARACALAERALLATLEAGCQAPVGAWARVEAEQLELRGAVYALDGQSVLEASGAAAWTDDAAARLDSAGAADARARELGARVARELLAVGAAELAPLRATPSSTPHQTSPRTETRQ